MPRIRRAAEYIAHSALHPRQGALTARVLWRKRKIERLRAGTYTEWFNKNQPTKTQLGNQKVQAKKFSYKPLVSVILPIYNTPKQYLRECIDSVLDQSYPNWELCIADDASTTDILALVKEYAAKHPNISFTSSTRNQHIAGASNEALKLAKGDFVALLDHDDLLTPDALFEMVKAINEDPKLDFVYSDEDKIEHGDDHTDPAFKPGWSPEFLKSCNYITHFAVLRRSTINKIGGFHLGTEGAQDWDLFLRFTQHTQRIKHVPKVLYSWRRAETSTAKTAQSKPYAYINQLRVLRDAVQAEKLCASVHATRYMGFWQIKYSLQNQPKVSIIIPTKNRYKYIKACLESIIEKSSYPNFEIVVVDTGSTSNKVKEFYQSKLIKENDLTILDWDKPFNFSGACNFGAKHAAGDYFLFLNNDTEVISPDWIENLLGLAQQQQIGMVGCKLLFSNHYIQHAGVVLSEREIAFHPFYNKDPRVDIYINVYISNIRNCAAVTAACAMVSKVRFNEVGGFDERLRVTYNDVDLCLRLLKAGYRNVYTPYSELFHHESVSIGHIHSSDRDKKELKEAKKLMQQRWSDILANDPYYNSNFIASGAGYILKD